MRRLVLISIVFIMNFLHFSIGQSLINQNTVLPDGEFENIAVKKIAGDSLASNFIIWVKDTVKTHKHEHHSETIYVIEGSAKMYMNDSLYHIKNDDVIFIPKNTWHAVKVTSPNALKVLSVQSPGFFGKDRIFKD